MPAANGGRSPGVGGLEPPFAACAGQGEGQGGCHNGPMTASAEAILEGLDEAQRQAACALDGPVRIVAGAGAGKTRTVTRRIAHACATGAWDPARTLAVTFSVKAAAEMRSRLSALGVDGAVRAATFHSAALHQVRRVWTEVTEAPFPTLADDRHGLVARAIRTAAPGLDEDDLTVRMVLAEINWCKVSLIAPSEYARVAAATHRDIPAGLDAAGFAGVYTAYEQEKTARGQIDFDDILLIACHILDAFPDTAAEIRRSVGWLTVDEYQDVSPLQHRLLSLWLGKGDNRNVCVVGDPAQTIYSFAGASSYDLLRFPEEFGPLSADVCLDTDYRSTPQIVGYANRVLAASPQRADYLQLRAGRPDGARVSRTVYASDEEEARGIAGRIRRAVARGVGQPSDFAVLTRINAQQRVICAALKAAGLRCRVRRDAGWADGAWAGDEAMRRAALEALGLGGDDGGAVTVSTIHAAKGLEFPHVFLAGCSEGLLPYGSPAPGELLEEERRLLYVGVTRAERSLHLSYARSKDGYGPQQRRVSRLLA